MLGADDLLVEALCVDGDDALVGGLEDGDDVAGGIVVGGIAGGALC